MTTRYARHPDLRLTAVEGEGIALQLGTRTYFTVNETGLVILEALAAPRTVEELADALLAQYEVPHGQAVASVQAFLERGVRARLIEEWRQA